VLTRAARSHRYRSSAGPGIRLDGVGYTGLTITPYYDSLLTKITARADSWGAACSRMRRALQEFTIDGVQVRRGAARLLAALAVGRVSPSVGQSAFSLVQCGAV
jgi:pyruvate carboxylase